MGLLKVWLPCNFGEVVKIKKHMGYSFEAYELVGLDYGCYDGGRTFTFRKVGAVGEDRHNYLMNIALEDTISYWPTALNNADCVDPSSLNPCEIDLLIDIRDSVKYSDYFNVRGTAVGKCIGIYKEIDGKVHYSFVGADTVGKYFQVDDFLVKGTQREEPKKDYKENKKGQLCLF